MSLARLVSKYNRHRKYKLFIDMMSPTSTTTLLDVGFSDREYSPYDNYIEKYYPFPYNITAIGIDDSRAFSYRYPQVRTITYDGISFPFGHNEFDICWSNAVIEHVGDIAAQIQFVSNIYRVSRRAFITTPNKYFPIEVHTHTPFLHYLPKHLFDRYLTLIGKSWATGSYMNLLSSHDICSIMKCADIKHFSILPNILFGLALDFIVVMWK